MKRLLHPEKDSRKKPIAKFSALARLMMMNSNRWMFEINCFRYQSSRSYVWFGHLMRINEIVSNKFPISTKSTKPGNVASKLHKDQWRDRNMDRFRSNCEIDSSIWWNSKVCIKHFSNYGIYQGIFAIIYF